MDCPRCATPLERLDLGAFAGEHPDVTIDRCPSCRGAWYDQGELDASDESTWTNAEELPLVPLDDAAPLPCPRCAASMSPVTFPGFSAVALDRCPSCAGFWLDAGELRALQEHVGKLDAAKMATMSRVPQPRRVKDAEGVEHLLFLTDDGWVDGGDCAGD